MDWLDKLIVPSTGNKLMLSLASMLIIGAESDQEVGVAVVTDDPANTEVVMGRFSMEYLSNQIGSPLRAILKSSKSQISEFTFPTGVVLMWSEWGLPEWVPDEEIEFFGDRIHEHPEVEPILVVESWRRELKRMWTMRLQFGTAPIQLKLGFHGITLVNEEVINEESLKAVKGEEAQVITFPSNSG